MAGRLGAVVVLDVSAGRLLFCHDGERAALRQARPGSTIKPFTLLALLASGRIDGQSRLACGRRVRLAGRSLHCTHPDDKDPVDPVAALAFSCNWFFVETARRLTPEELLRTFEQFGLGARTGLREPENSGLLRRAATLEQLQLQAIGESAIEVTPLGLAWAYRRLARNLDRYPLVRDGLAGCVHYGTGQLARRGSVAIAGKTGTATSRSGAFTHAWFAGFAPAGSPAVVVTVFLEQGQGAADAAPVAGAVLEALR